MEPVYFLGIDVSKETFNTALTLNGRDFHEDQLQNKPSSISAFFRDLKKQLSSFTTLVVCLEHTGIYCQPLLNFLSKNQIRVCVEPGLQIKQSQGMTRGKNDDVDAKRIASYAFKNRDNLTLWKPQRGSLQKLKALLTLRERLIKVKNQLEVPINEGHGFIDPIVSKQIARQCSKSIKSLKDDIKKTDESISKLVREDEHLNKQYNLVTSVPGVGKITALNVILSTNEFTRIQDAKKFACYAGVAPFEHSSGTSIRGRTRVSKMANMAIKRLLHLAAMSAITCSEELKSYYQRKVQNGKNKMSALNAVRNKLISRIFACIKNDRMYQKEYKNALA
jgi:transposase